MYIYFDQQLFNAMFSFRYRQNHELWLFIVEEEEYLIGYVQ